VLDITQNLRNIKERFEYMMLEMYVECFTDQLMLHCKNILISNNLVPGVAVRSDPQTRTMILTLYG
jgi:hypothetical protein